MVVGWVLKGEVMKIELRDKVGEELNSGEVGGVYIGIPSHIDGDTMVFI